MAAVCNRHLTIRPKPLADVAPRVPRDLGYVIDRAIDAEPARRWSSMVDFGDALRGALQRLLAPQRAIARNVPLPNRDLALASTLPLSTSSDDFKLSEPAPSAPRANDEATSSAAQPRRFWKTLTITANEPSARSPEPARAEPSEPATVELPTRAEQRPRVASSPPDHVSNPPMSAPARASTAPMSSIALGLVVIAVLVAGAAGFALGQLRAAPSAGAPAPSSAPPSSNATAPCVPCK